MNGHKAIYTSEMLDRKAGSIFKNNVANYWIKYRHFQYCNLSFPPFTLAQEVIFRKELIKHINYQIPVDDWKAIQQTMQVYLLQRGFK